MGGLDDVYYIYSNPDQTIDGKCTTAATLPGSYSKNDNITIQQTCTSFTPALIQGANLIVMVFYTHHETFDNVLMYNFPIPGYVNDQDTQARVLGNSEKKEILEKVKKGEMRIKNLVVE